MTCTPSRTLVLAFVVAVFAGGASLFGWAQHSAAPDVLGTLLIEVRGLRAALEQMATAGPRVQLALGRVQLQEQRIANQVRRLDAVRANLVPAQKGLEPLEREAKELEDSFRRSGPSDSEARRLAEDNLKEFKAEVARRRAEVQRLLTEEAFLTQDISAEQNRWADFNQRLEDLERALGRR
jgi:hypothetical protein